LRHSIIRKSTKSHGSSSNDSAVAPALEPSSKARHNRRILALILTISGSLRAGSSNTATLEALALLAPAGVTVRRYDELDALPAFNPDLESSDLPEPVARLRALIGQADAIVISSPEYARGMAGSLKNMLDWLVGALEFPGKPVATITTSQRAEYAPEQLKLVLTTMSADIVEAACITLPLLGKTLTARQIACDPALAALLVASLGTLRDRLSKKTSDDAV
jgi:chromate reductase